MKPVIKEAMETAMQASLAQIQTDVAANTSRITKAEQRISTLEDEIQDKQVRLQTTEKHAITLADIMNDLENRARTNKLRVVGLLEHIKANNLTRICKRDISKTLGLENECEVERAYRSGNPQVEQRGPRQVIVRYMNYGDNMAILQRFRSNRALQIEGSELLIFADYTIALSSKRKLFSNLCTKLYHKQIRFSLAYPSILNIPLPDGGQHSFYDHQEAKNFFECMDNKELTRTPKSGLNHTPSNPTKINRRILNTPQQPQNIANH